MAFIHRQLCKGRKMRKGLRDFKLAECSVLTLVDTQLCRSSELREQLAEAQTKQAQAVSFSLMLG